MLGSYSILIGCLVGVVSLATQSIGLTLQRKSHLTEESKPIQRAAYRRPLWQLGCLLFIVSNVVGSSIQISTLPLIILSPLQAVGLVFNSICGAMILHESSTKYMFEGTLFVSMGALFIAYFGSIPEPNHNLQELLELLKRTLFLVWFCLSVVVLVCILLYISILKYYVQTTDPDDDLETEPLLSSASSAKDSRYLSTRQNRLICYVVTACVHKDKIPFLQGILYGVVCGILSAHALLLAKSAVELVIVAVTQHTITDLKSYQSWLILSGWVFCAIMQVYYLNLGLKIISSSIIFPLIFCVYNMVNILNGLIYFNQFNKLTVSEIVMIFVGVCLILLGVFYLSINDILGNTNSSKNVSDEYHINSNDDYANYSDEAADTVPPLNTSSTIKGIAINDNVSVKSHPSKYSSHTNTPTSSISKAPSVNTYSSINPILPESFTSNKLHMDE